MMSDVSFDCFGIFRLAQRAYEGDSYLYLQDTVNWEVGQEIVLVTSALRDSRDWHQNEVFTIDNIQTSGISVPNVGSIIWLDGTVKHDHIARQEYQVEVGLLTRMIKIQASGIWTTRYKYMFFC